MQENDEKPLVSVIVPIYNSSTYLGECLLSIINQTYKDTEIILVNDGSTDNSLEVCEDFARKDCRIKIVDRENGGAGAARNTGIEHSTGQYVMFVDGDDIIMPTMIEEHIEARKIWDADVICSSFLPWDKNDKCLAPLPEFTRFNGIQAVEAILLFKIDRSPCMKLIKRSALTVRFPEGCINEDFPFLVHLYMENNKILYMPKAFYRYRVVNTSVTHTFSEKYFDIVKNARLIENDIPMHDANINKAFHIYEDRALIDSAMKIVRAGLHSEFKLHLSDARSHIRKNIKRIFTSDIGWRYKVKAITAFVPFKFNLI